MPYRAPLFAPILIETARAAEAVFGNGNVHMAFGDQLDCRLADVSFDLPDATGAKPVPSLAIAALVTIFQFAEHLADHRAADALRSRLDLICIAPTARLSRPGPFCLVRVSPIAFQEFRCTTDVSTVQPFLGGGLQRREGGRK